MKEENTDEKSAMNAYRIIGLTFLLMAFIFLLTAAALQGTGTRYLGARLFLIIIGGSLTVSGGVIILLGKSTSAK